MSFPDDDSGSSNDFKRSRHYQSILTVVFLAGVAGAVWYMAAGLMRLGEENSKIENGNLYGESPKAAAKSPSAKTPSVEPRPEDDPGSIEITPEPQAPARGRKGASEWRLRGTVYDLATLQPLAGCTLRFTDAETNRSVRTRTDSAGRYRTIVAPSSGGYTVSIDKDGYSRNYLDPGTEGVREMGAARRHELARELATTVAEAPATVVGVDEKPFVTDFYLAPRP